MSIMDHKDKFDKWDNMVIEYRLSDCPRVRNRIFKELRTYYLPKVYSVLEQFDKRNRDEGLAIYDMLLLQCIDRWKGCNSKGVFCHFTTYWYPYAGVKVKSEVLEKYVWKDNRMASLDAYEEYDDWD